MLEFTYEARAKTGAMSSGTLSANSEREAMAMLDAKGLFPIRLQPAKVSLVGGSGGKKVKNRFVASAFTQLADLLHSGVPLLRSLEILERQSSAPALKTVLKEVRADVADGTTLADAMGKHPEAFNELTVSMVRAGQEGGFLEDVLKRIAEFTEHQEDLKAKVVGSMAYPVFLAIIGFIILNILVVFFVPRFEPIFKKLEEKGELPGITVFVTGISHFMTSYGIFIVAAAALAFFLYKRWARTEAGRRTVDGWLLKIPGMGGIVLNLAIARFTRILGTMLHNGIPILQALRISKDSTGNKVLAEAIEKSAENVTAGNSLATPLAQCRYFPRDVCEMVAVAEESNSLEKVLIDIANGMEKRTSRQLELFVRLLEPLMLLGMAGVTLVIVAGLLLPVFKMGSAAK